ncbi:MAG: TRAP transporter fused permease subunit [Spirochaetales bacterium]|nr:TRAP transporter fused permease subunit [Spirochaetales bacterium]
MKKDNRILNWVTIAVCLAAGIFHLSVGVKAMSTMTLRTWHWMFMVVLVFIAFPAKKGGEVLRWYDWILLIIGVLTAAYIIWQWPSRGQLLAANDPNLKLMDKIVGVLTILIVLEATRRTTGIAMAITATVALVYLFWLGPYMPGILLHKGYSFDRVMPYMMFTTEGLFGISLGTCASFIVLFVLFGAFLQATGGGQFFIDAAYSLTGKFRGGPAKTAVVSSALMGCISGSPIANVVTTGTFTIPLMKNAGYEPETACSIEAVASTGGMLMPPMMGAAAFIMAEYLNMQYGQICVAAIVPALMYYAVLFIIVDKEAAKKGILGLPKESLPKLKDALLSRGHLLVPLLVLIICLFNNFSPQKTVFWSTIILVAISFLRKQTRLTPMAFLDAFRKGLTGVVSVATACAAAGLVVMAISMTGLGVRFTSSIVTISGGNPFIALIFTMLASLILGMGLPAAAVYIVVACVAAPALINMGFSPLASHMFVFYFGIISTITPPVALTAYAAAGLSSGASAIRVGFKAFLYAIIAFILPYIWMYEPSFLLDASVAQIIPNLVIAAVSLFFIASGTVGYLFNKITPVGRVFCYILAALMLVPFLTVNYIGLGLGVVMMVLNRLHIIKFIETKEGENGK